LLKHYSYLSSKRRIVKETRAEAQLRTSEVQKPKNRASNVSVSNAQRSFVAKGYKLAVNLTSVTLNAILLISR
jgi:hypothetical protein